MTELTPNNISLRGLSRLSKGRKIGLYGGSFNPVHAGHIHLVKQGLNRLGLDEVWVLVTPGNPLKNNRPDMAPLAQRLIATKQAIKGPRVRVFDLETPLDTRYTADTVTKLITIMPRTHFVWMMGADNAQIFHHWGQWRKIVTIVPIAIFDRTGYSKTGRSSRLTREYGRFKVQPEKLAGSQTPCWAFINNARHPASSTMIRHQSDRDWWDQ